MHLLPSQTIPRIINIIKHPARHPNRIRPRNINRQTLLLHNQIIFPPIRRHKLRQQCRRIPRRTLLRQSKCRTVFMRKVHSNLAVIFCHQPVHPITLRHIRRISALNPYLHSRHSHRQIRQIQMHQTAQQPDRNYRHTERHHQLPLMPNPPLLSNSLCHLLLNHNGLALFHRRYPPKRLLNRPFFQFLRTQLPWCRRLACRHSRIYFRYCRVRHYRSRLHHHFAFRRTQLFLSLNINSDSLCQQSLLFSIHLFRNRLAPRHIFLILLFFCQNLRLGRRFFYKFPIQRRGLLQNLMFRRTRVMFRFATRN